MNYHRDPDEPAVRVVQPAGDAPLAPRPGRLALLVAAAVGAAIGFLVGGIATGVGSGERSATTGGQIDLAEPGAGLGAPTTTATTTTTTAPTTTAAPAGPAAVPFPDLVPGLDGTLVIALPEEGELWVWPGDAPVPERTPLPAATGDAVFNADASAVAALAGPLRERTLFVTRNGFVPVFVGARNFAWHATDPSRIAWIADEDGPQLQVAQLTDDGVAVEQVRPLAPTGASRRIASWGDWGFVLSEQRADAPERVVTLDAGAEVIADTVGEVISVRDDGILLIADPSGGHVVTDLDLVPTGPGPQGLLGAAVWSPPGLLLAGVVGTPLGPSLQVDDLAGLSFRTVLGVDVATVLGWAGGERFAVMWSPDAEELVPGNRAVAVPALIIVDVLDRSTHAVPVPSLPSDLVWLPA